MPPLTASLQPARHWHSSQSPAASGWAEAVPTGALCLHLNFQGEGELEWATDQKVRVSPRQLLWSRGARSARRLAGRERHECLTLVFPDSWLLQALHESHAEIPPLLRPLVSSPFRDDAVQARGLTAEDRTWAYALMAPHLCEQARRLLDSARLTDFLVQELFPFAEAAAQSPAAVSRTQRAARERVERAKALLLEHLDENLTLDVLATAAGCSPHYLSRTFTQVEGLPLILWLRRARIERAAELIASGQCNVSEAALEVGYRSFSHFSRAFAEEKGVPPSRWVLHLSTQKEEFSTIP